MQLGSFALAGLLLYLALRGVDLSRMGDAFRTADYRWLAPLIGVALFSLGLRAWRWQVLLQALPPDAASGATGDATDDARAPTVHFSDAFTSLTIGYMVNYAAPRLGEVARTANLSARAQLSFSAIFGTVVIERVLDMAVLLLALLSVIPIMWPQLPAIRQSFIEPALDRLAELPFAWLALIGGGLLVLTLGLVGWAYRALQDQSSAMRQLWTSTVQPALVAFRNGVSTLWRSPRRGVLVGTTLGMWGGYVLMAYWPFVMLGTAEPYAITLVDAWALMAIGALGIVVPSPGGVGSYHFITTEALIILFGMPRADAATYAVLTHAAQFVLFVAGGLLCLLWQGVSVRALQRRTRRAETETAPPSDSPTT
jgi:hypothetical protein